MTRNHRFASLTGQSRKWLAPDEELEAMLDFDSDVPVDGEAVHDGCDSMAPRRLALARLGDVISLDPRRG